MNKEELTYFQYAALEGEVAFALTTSPHNAEMKYRIYMTLKELPNDLRKSLVESIKGMVTFDEAEIDRILLEISNKSVPVWLWIERCIADLKLASSPIAEVQPAVCKLSINKSKAKKALVRSAFIMLIRNSALNCPKSTIELCNTVLEDNDLKFLHCSCFSLLQEVEEIYNQKPKSLPNPSILDVSFDIKDLMSYRVERELVEDLSDVFKSANERKTRKKTPKVIVEDKIESTSDEFSSEEISQFLSEKLEELFTGQAPKPSTKKKTKSVKFVVQKTFNGSNLSTTLKVFDTQEEALNFVEQMERDFPELKQTCRIEIFKDIR